MAHQLAGFLVLIGAIGGAFINRARGWGGGWNKTNKPTWLVWAQKWIFSREVLAVCMGVLVSAFAYYMGVPRRECLYAIPEIAFTWLFAVSEAWAGYMFADPLPVVRGVTWIDNFLNLKLRPWLLLHDSKTLQAWGNSPDFMDSIGFGLRDLYYLPMFLCLGQLAHWWILLPIAFFWQDALVYHLARKAGGDVALNAEPASGYIRTLFMLVAVMLHGFII